MHSTVKLRLSASWLQAISQEGKLLLVDQQISRLESIEWASSRMQSRLLRFKKCIINNSRLITTLRWSMNLSSNNNSPVPQVSTLLPLKWVNCRSLRWFRASHDRFVTITMVVWVLDPHKLRSNSNTKNSSSSSSSNSNSKRKAEH